MHTPFLTHRAVSSLSLADGATWFLVPRNERAFHVVSQLTKIMLFKPLSSLEDKPNPGLNSIPASAFIPGQSDAISHLDRSINQLHISVDAIGPEAPSANSENKLLSIHYLTRKRQRTNWQNSRHFLNFLSPDNCRSIECRLQPVDNDDSFFIQLQCLSLIMAHEAEQEGGLLLHGALAEWQGQGIILAGPGGVGKSTASRRLPSSWRSLADDMTLIVRDAHDTYWAHPWPTWSRFFFGEGAGSWDIQQAVPLKGIFFLSPTLQDRIDPLRPVDAACSLNESAEQASRPALLHYKKTALREHRLRRLDSICTLVNQVPYYRLLLSLHGDFWNKIQQVLIDKPGGQFQE